MIDKFKFLNTLYKYLDGNQKISFCGLGSKYPYHFVCDLEDKENLINKFEISDKIMCKTMLYTPFETRFSRNVKSRCFRKEIRRGKIIIVDVDIYQSWYIKDQDKYNERRESFSNGLNWLLEKIDLKPTMFVDSGGNGVGHLYYVLDRWVDDREYEIIHRKINKEISKAIKNDNYLSRKLMVDDVQANQSFVLPGSRNKKTGKIVSVKEETGKIYQANDFVNLKTNIKPFYTEKELKEKRKEYNNKIKKIVKIEEKDIENIVNVIHENQRKVSKKKDKMIDLYQKIVKNKEARLLKYLLGATCLNVETKEKYDEKTQTLVDSFIKLYSYSEKSNKNPYISCEVYGKFLGISKLTASKKLNELIAMGIIKEKQGEDSARNWQILIDYKVTKITEKVTEDTKRDTEEDIENAIDKNSDIIENYVEIRSMLGENVEQSIRNISHFLTADLIKKFNSNHNYFVYNKIFSLFGLTFNGIFSESIEIYGSGQSNQAMCNLGRTSVRYNLDIDEMLDKWEEDYYKYTSGNHTMEELRNKAYKVREKCLLNKRIAA